MKQMTSRRFHLTDEIEIDNGKGKLTSDGD
jgi:hypothetical protein